MEDRGKVRYKDERHMREIGLGKWGRKGMNRQYEGKGGRGKGKILSLS